MSEHTPGPWRLNPHDDFAVLGPDNFRVADCGNPSWDQNAPSVERQKANARLIAAAPEMLKALQIAIARADKNLEEYYSGPRDDDCKKDYELCKTAIAKATGGE